MRAVSVRVDDVVGVGGFILPGNRVDVIAARATGERAYAETILSNVKVLAVDQQASADKSAPARSSRASDRRARRPSPPKRAAAMAPENAA